MGLDVVQEGQERARSGKADPPLLIGGLHHVTLQGVRVDFLTATVPARDVGLEAVASQLLADSSLEEAGYAGRGFQRSERRKTWGGFCWRRLAPYQESKAWGFDYESWEWDGGSADHGAQMLRGLLCRPSRVDIAVDLDCPEDMRPEDLAEAVREHVEAVGISQGIASQDGVSTCYVGSAASPRRIRVYRKDRQSLAWGHVFGPTLRVELVLREDHAVAWWKVWARSEEAAYRAAAAHIEAMTGLALVPEAGEVPQVEVPQESELAERTALFVQQHGNAVATFDAVGVPIIELCREHLAAGASRWSRQRVARRVKQWQEAGVSAVVTMTRQLLGLRAAAADGASGPERATDAAASRITAANANT